MRAHLILFAIGLLLPGSAYPVAAQDPIVIHNKGENIPPKTTTFDMGPTDPSAQVNVGNILNVHYFLGINLYAQANYRYAKNEMDYVIARPSYFEKNPRQAQILSTAHFIRGSIYFRHASGLERLSLAKSDFEESIKWNSENHLARLELARLLATLGQKPDAISMLTELLTAKLNPKLRQEAETDLASLKAGTFKAVTSD
jgi:hypothetical protein